MARRNRSQRVLADERRALVQAMCEGVTGHPRLAMRLATATDRELEDWGKALRRKVRGVVVEDARDREQAAADRTGWSGQRNY